MDPSCSSYSKGEEIKGSYKKMIGACEPLVTYRRLTGGGMVGTGLTMVGTICDD